jgi:hypothetical protein
LLVLACDVLEPHNPAAPTEPRKRAAELQQLLLALVNDEAAAFRAFLRRQPC